MRNLNFVGAALVAALVFGCDGKSQNGDGGYPINPPECAGAACATLAIHSNLPAKIFVDEIGGEGRTWIRHRLEVGQIWELLVFVPGEYAVTAQNDEGGEIGAVVEVTRAGERKEVPCNFEIPQTMVTVHVRGAPPGAVVGVDGAATAVLPESAVPIPQDGRTHEITVVAPAGDYGCQVRTVDMTAVFIPESVSLDCAFDPGLKNWECTEVEGPEPGVRSHPRLEIFEDGITLVDLGNGHSGGPIVGTTISIPPDEENCSLEGEIDPAGSVEIRYFCNGEMYARERHTCLPQ